MPETLGVTVVNLPRRADRRAWVAASVGLDAAPPGTALRFLAALPFPLQFPATSLLFYLCLFAIRLGPFPLPP